MKIIADTATLYTPEHGAALGLDMVTVGVAIDGRSYADYTDITTAQFLEKIRAGGVPSSSQPALGDLLELFESSPEEMLVLMKFMVSHNDAHAQELADLAISLKENGKGRTGEKLMDIVSVFDTVYARLAAIVEEL